MRKLLTMLAVVGALAASQCFALNVNVNRLPGYFAGDGGEFNVNPIIGNGYASVCIVQGGFETFCSDIHSPIHIPGTYVAQPLVPVGNFLVEYLYNQFARGVLTDYDYTPGPAGTRPASAEALQIAIWNLLGQVGPPPSGSLADDFIKDANANAVQGKDYFVSELPLNDLTGKPVQPLFVLQVPNQPDGGLTVLLLGMALTGLGWVSRRSKA